MFYSSFVADTCTSTVIGQTALSLYKQSHPIKCNVFNKHKVHLTLYLIIYITLHTNVFERSYTIPVLGCFDEFSSKYPASDMCPASRAIRMGMEKLTFPLCTRGLRTRLKISNFSVHEWLNESPSLDCIRTRTVSSSFSFTAWHRRRNAQIWLFRWLASIHPSKLWAPALISDNTPCQYPL